MRNQRDRNWYIKYILIKTTEIKGSPKILDVYQLANSFEQSLGVYLLNQFLHDTVCINLEFISAMHSKLEPVPQGYRQGLRPEQFGV